MTPEDKSHEPAKTQVPGQFLGYGLQYTRMLSLLLESGDDAVVSLEVFEDIGVHDDQGKLASQTKSSIAGQNPIANRAEPFWKSLHNWLEAIKAGRLSPVNTLFELYVFGDFEGEICSLFSDAKSESEATAAISKAEKLLRSSDKALSNRIKAVLGADQVHLVPLITRFRYRHGSGAFSGRPEGATEQSSHPERIPRRCVDPRLRLG